VVLRELIDKGVNANRQGNQRKIPDTHQVVFAISVHCSDFTLFYLGVSETKFRFSFDPSFH
jgi:hypothetical protein